VREASDAKEQLRATMARVPGGVESDEDELEMWAHLLTDSTALLPHEWEDLTYRLLLAGKGAGMPDDLLGEIRWRMLAIRDLIAPAAEGDAAASEGCSRLGSDLAQLVFGTDLTTLLYGTE
jgi:hypothetical protein